jgi:hypothetical protein
MSAKRIPVPPPPPPPPAYVETVVCDGCHKEQEPAPYGACMALAHGWIRAYVVGENSAPRWTIDLCPDCRKGAIIVLANERQLHLENA